ncbi:hypothetical protein San01_49240 [Streptomyces angustmyceticus]|uniref:Uncharacterized protein n=1 Tax=Streptomyces angustmyceticus TaxID=285578 RepID=A0A5J4LE41_9ACTN|nr:hypothetical protein San01_49240 [Streptomyces angustmyceticus]
MLPAPWSGRPRLIRIDAARQRPAEPAAEAALCAAVGRPLPPVPPEAEPEPVSDEAAGDGPLAWSAMFLSHAQSATAQAAASTTAARWRARRGEVEGDIVLPIWWYVYRSLLWYTRPPRPWAFATASPRFDGNRSGAVGVRPARSSVVRTSGNEPLRPHCRLADAALPSATVMVARTAEIHWPDRTEPTDDVHMARTIGCPPTGKASP